MKTKHTDAFFNVLVARINFTIRCNCIWLETLAFKKKITSPLAIQIIIMHALCIDSLKRYYRVLPSLLSTSYSHWLHKVKKVNEMFYYQNEEITLQGEHDVRKHFV